MATLSRPFLVSQVKAKPAETQEDAVRKVYDKALDDVALAPQGQRNIALNTSAYTVGRLAGAGLVAEVDALADLRQAGRGTGQQPWDVEKTVLSGYKRGLLKPWEVAQADVVAIPRPSPAVSEVAEQQRREMMAKAEAARDLHAGGWPVEGTRGQAYLEGRGIAAWPDTVRWSADAGCLVFPLEAQDGTVSCVQKVPVGPDGRRGEKRTNGPMGNALFKVPGKAGAPAVVVDGPEDALSVALATGWRVYAACNKTRFPHVLDHLAPGDRLVAVRDADGTDNSEYNRLAERCLEARVELTFADPPEGKDANDVLRAGGAQAVRAWLGGAAEAAWPSRPAPSRAPAGAGLAAEAFPRHLLRAPGALGTVADWITRTARYPQPELALGTAITLLGSLMGRRVQGPTGLRTNVMGLGLADSGSGKGHGRAMAKRLLQELGVPELLGGDSIRSGAGLVSRLREQPNTLYLLDEVGMFLGSAYDRNAGAHMKEIVALFTQFFSEAGQTWMGSDYADRKLNAPIPIVQPHMGLFGITNPTSLWNAFGGGALKDGSVARYLVFHPNEMYPGRAKAMVSDATVPASVLDPLNAIVRDIPVPESRGNLAALAMADPSPHRVPIAADAEEALLDYEDANVLDRRKAAGTDRASIIARAVEHAWKIACIAAVADNPGNPCIGLGHARYGMDLATWSTDWLDKKASVHVADSDFGRKLNKVHEILRNAGEDGMSRADLTRATRRILSGSRERDDILADLRVSGLVAAQASDGPQGEHYWVAENAPRPDNGFDEEEAS